MAKFTSTPTKAQIRSQKAARTRKFNELDAAVASGSMTLEAAAGFKSQATKKLNAMIRAVGESPVYAS